MDRTTSSKALRYKISVMARAGSASPTSPSTTAPSARSLPSPYSRRPRACSQSSEPSVASDTRAPDPAFAISFAKLHPLYVAKAEKKGRTKKEVDEIITWLTGYSAAQLRKVIADELDLETFFKKAPRLNPKAKLITGVVCHVRVEDIDDPLMKKIRYLDKLIDELAKGKKMESILRE